MRERRPHASATATIPRRGPTSARRLLLDAVFGSFVEWREESATLRGAWAYWCQSTHADGAAAYAAYRAALEREAAAAAALARLCERATCELGPV